MAIIIDCDSHFTPRDVFDDVDPRFENRAPRLWFDAAGRARITNPEREAKLNPHQALIWRGTYSWYRHGAGTWDPEPRLEFMDRLGIQLQVLVPTEQFHYDIEADLGTSMCQSYNNAISRLLRKYPGRFLGIAHLPMQSPSRAVKEMDRAITELGLHAAHIYSNIDGRNLDEPEFWPVYQKIEELTVPLIIHPGRFGKFIGMERVTKFHLENSLGFLYEGTQAITSFICGGVLDLFPRLRIGMLETGCGYLPTLMDRLNEVYEVEGVNKLIKKAPHEYLNQFWLSANVSREKETIPHVVQRFGANRLVMGTDFPHGLGGTGEGAIQDVMNNPHFTEEQKSRILGLNAAELFGIPVD